MLFHITHRHTEANCPYHDWEVASQTFARVPETMKAAGVVVLGSYVNAAAHAVHMIVEADTAEAIQAGLDPIIDMGTADTEPVVGMADLMADREDNK